MPSSPATPGAFIHDSMPSSSSEVCDGTEPGESLMSQTFQMDADWLPFDPSPSKPTYTPPLGAVDAHCHVFGPGDEFPYAPERKYTPCDAGKDLLFATRDFLGLSRNVIVQATCHGADNRAMVDALGAANGLARGVATIKPDISADELKALDEAGVRGVRFNFVKRLVDPKPDAYYLSLVEQIAPFGWHIVVYFEAADLAERWNFFTSLPTTVVVDHMGRPDVTKPLDGPEFGLFSQLMAEHPNVWSKVSGPERLSVSGPLTFDQTLGCSAISCEKRPNSGPSSGLVTSGRPM